MKTVFLALVALAVAGCGGKQSPDAAAVDSYVNKELAPLLSSALAARAAYSDIRAVDVDDRSKLAELRYRLTDAAVPLLDRALEGAGKLTPPEAAKWLHDSFVGTVTEERAALAEMSAALSPVDPDRFKLGHDKMMSAYSSVLRWSDKLDRLLRQHGVKLQPLPDVDVPRPTPRPEPAPAAAVAESPPCAPGSEKKQGDVLVECVLARAEKLCEPGKPVTFHPSGAIKTCTTQMGFAPPETPASAPKESVLVCGPGELGYTETGAVASCVIISDVMVGAARVPKGSRITLGANATVVAATLPDGSAWKP